MKCHSQLFVKELHRKSNTNLNLMFEPFVVDFSLMSAVYNVPPLNAHKRQTQPISFILRLKY